MNESRGPWKLEERIARLNVGSLQAQFDLQRPWLGLHDVRWNDVAAKDCRLLYVEQNAAVDFYVRVNDLVVTYPQTDEVTGTCQFYWRVLESTSLPGIVAVDLQVSVNTSLLDATSGSQVFSCLDGEVFRREIEAERFSRQPLAVEEFVVRKPSLYLVRPKDTAWSYVEVAHPDDFCLDGVGLAPNQTELGRLFHLLTVRHLEKGVILRSRVRGAFVPREGDEAAAMAVYEQFVNAPLPLTT